MRDLRQDLQLARDLLAQATKTGQVDPTHASAALAQLNALAIKSIPKKER